MPNKAYDMIRLIRPYQWTKNILLVLPLALAHKIDDPAKLHSTLWALAAFCLAASAGYVANDLFDREHDKIHPTKQKRPIASGSVSPFMASMLILTLLAGAAVIVKFTLSAKFAGLLGIYLAITLAYSMYLKSRLIVDVIVLAGLYTLRLIAGGVAADVPVTPWLMSLSMFLFLSLAFAKRYAELLINGVENEPVAGRSYSLDDLHMIESVGPTSGYMAVLILMMYIADGASKGSALYRKPEILWLVCPVFLYWITRVWFFVRRKAIGDDPVLFAIKDPKSWIAGGLCVLIVWLAI